MTRRLRSQLPKLSPAELTRAVEMGPMNVITNAIIVKRSRFIIIYKSFILALSLFVSLRKMMNRVLDRTLNHLPVDGLDPVADFHAPCRLGIRLSYSLLRFSLHDRLS